ncbi:helix-turn-helix domain-containing protein [Actinophytocola gossypii]|uniref:Helix-turn-helix transcriptional regulator n=1 Tax=Actinophytocola gossypii TaxID=2812003 RepID=A0ABT2J646_9PSEU|nr:helix-turn-helix transcriptional regulator [Actinophytocola gossypii]MCT2583332.1 helix-turn-helix transcriptional regulator [Actinophytocola gossypii]
MTLGGSGGDLERQLIAEEVRAQRETRRLTQDELARQIGFSHSTVKNIESGYRMPTREQAALLDKVFGTAGMLCRLEARIRAAPISPGFRPFVAAEAEARTIKTFEHTLVPGLLQTEDYARTLVEAYPGLTSDEVTARVAAKLNRQRVLDTEEPPWLWAVIDEHVLRREIGGPGVMAAQLAKLAEFARRPRITIQLISAARAHTALAGAFVIAELARQPAVAYLDTVLDGQTVQDPAMVEMTTVVFDTIRTDAYSGDESLELIEEGVQQWKQRTAS